ncbi:O-antigen ligase family protein [Winogradskyella sp. A2]|uniref:O-antigen ligase family protein n=1 Tax=Winogradskyella sp. A2 TaxID=3366944 RepID=UPI00398C79FA
MPQLILKAGLLLLLFVLSFYSIELSFVVSVLVLLISITKSISFNILISSLLLLCIVFIGIVSSYELKHPFYEFLKDNIYFFRPVTVLTATYFSVKRIKSQNFVFNALVFVALLFAVNHLYKIIININNIDSYIYLRNLGGKQNHIEAIALVFLFFTPYVTLFSRYRKLIIFVLLASFVLYLSRTMFIILFIYFLGYKGYLFLNKRFVKAIFIFAFVGAMFGFIVTNIETNRDSKGLKAFIYKTQNSLTELFEPIDAENILKDRRALWEHWRAYEAVKAIDQVNSNGFKAWVIGMGFGSQIELDTYVNLDGKKFTKVPSIHNGFINILFKTGVLGLVCYVFFIFHIFAIHQKILNEDKNISLMHKLIIASSLYILVNSFVINGIFRPGEFSIFLYGALVASKYKFKNNIIPFSY